ncbi:MAG: DUF5675 family protein [Chloroflexota bacterium]
MKEIQQGSISGPIQNSFVYDDDGNMTQKKNSAGTVIQSIAYDAKGRAKSITTSGVGTATTLTYDLYDYRIGKIDSTGSRKYLLEGEHLEAIVSDNNWKAMYLRGTVIDEIVNAYYFGTDGKWVNYTFHHDALQSVLGLSGHEGSVLQTIQYGPFGEKIATTGNANNNGLHYTGREEDPDTGLYNYRARLYDPTIGRFITEDPKGFEAGVNFYAYVNNNPINANDPRGLDVVVTIIRDTYTAKSVTGTFYVNSDITKKTLNGFTLETMTGGPHKDQPPIPTGSYDAFIRTNHTPNRIELKGTDPRTNIQIHNANYPKQLSGCIAVGDSRSTDFVGNSVATMNGVLDIVNEDKSGNIKVNVQTARDFDIPGQATNEGASGSWGYVLDSSSAAGGYLIYPNKTNTNIMRSVYSK